MRAALVETACTYPLSCPAGPQGATKFAAALGEAAAGADGGVALPLPEQQFLSAVVGHRPGSIKSLTKAAANPLLVAAFAAALSSWSDSVEAALREGVLEGKDAEDAGVTAGAELAGVGGCRVKAYAA